MTLKVGIIGYGRMGEIRHKAIDEVGRAQVIAVSEPNLSIELKNIPNLSHDEIINHPNIDIIIVCTPNFLINH